MGAFTRRQQSAATKSVTQMSTASEPLGIDGVAGNGQVALTWTTPLDDGGSSITDYQVVVSPATGVTGNITRLVGSATTSYTFSGLTNGTTYTFSISAITAYGVGAAASSPATVPNTGGVLATPSFTSIDVTNFQAAHSFSAVSGATLYRIELQKVG